MEYYTAKQLAELLQQDDPNMNLRTVRYYTQIGIVPPLELAGNKRVYTDTHVHYFRAILTLSRSGETLAQIQEKLKKLTMDEIINIGESLRLYQSNRLLHNETHVINEDVVISMSPRIPPELKTKMVETIHQLLKGDARS